jgi:diguanylate cyclase
MPSPPGAKAVLHHLRLSHSQESGAPESDAAERPSLDLALNRSEAVKEKVENVAEDLESTNEAVRDRLSAGIATVPARQSLHDGQRIESSVKEVAHDIDQVIDALSQGLDHLERSDAALIHAQETLMRTEDALAHSQHQEEVSRHRSLHDPLTGLPNRELFDDRLAQAIAMAERHAWTLAVMFIDLDRFKTINDERGHAAGDAVLKQTALRLNLYSREEDTVCRLGGDEFLILLINPQGAGTAERIAQGVLKEISAPIEMEGLSMRVAASIGIACYPEHATTAVQLVSNADAAMYAAKGTGDGVRLWSKADLRVDQKSRSRAPHNQSSIEPISA